ncbi:MAG: hypothetical protein PHQ66_03080 [Candidatus Nanoarchaeia archaeon]|nr:hypothetical protein [Candidatus Nanoarchaeia archaeon]MDD5357650.1 hypothetical protein [Candidatus Nanoarchaeia archaeon]MDD5588569.1 hypothetical protein [Candidatus Nanoarchaeia archaeon]
MKIKLEYNNRTLKETDNTGIDNEGLPPLLSAQIYNAINFAYQKQMKIVSDYFPNKSVVSKLEIELTLRDKEKKK